jgi:hypothetical protein
VIRNAFENKLCQDRYWHGYTPAELKLLAEAPALSAGWLRDVGRRFVVRYGVQVFATALKEVSSTGGVLRLMFLCEIELAPRSME